jgi:hypothetical protein
LSLLRNPSGFGCRFYALSRLDSLGKRRAHKRNGHKRGQGGATPFWSPFTVLALRQMTVGTAQVSKIAGQGELGRERAEQSRDCTGSTLGNPFPAGLFNRRQARLLAGDQPLRDPRSSRNASIERALAHLSHQARHLVTQIV